MGIKQEEKNAEPFYILDYIMRNSDREKWMEISSFVKRNVDPSVRLLDKLEAMAVPAANDSYSEISLEPEDLPIIPLPSSETAGEKSESKKRGRKPKVEEALTV